MNNVGFPLFSSLPENMTRFKKPKQNLKGGGTRVLRVFLNKICDAACNFFVIFALWSNISIALFKAPFVTKAQDKGTK